MGQINCQQCQMPLLSDAFRSQNMKVKKQQPTSNKTNNNLHKINILSKRRSSLQALSLPIKYANHTQTTVQDSEQNSIKDSKFSSNNSTKQMCCMAFSNTLQRFQFQFQKNKKIMIGTSKNCHFNINKNEIQNKQKCKISVLYDNESVKIKDMGLGTGSYLKSSIIKLNQINSKNNQVFLIQDIFIKIRYQVMKNSQNFFRVQIQQLSTEKSEVYILKPSAFNIYYSLQSNQYKFQTSMDNLSIVFTLQLSQSYQTQNPQYFIKFHNSNIWKYLKHYTKIQEGQILKMGSSIYKIEKLMRFKDLSCSNQLKIIQNQNVDD